LLFVETNEFDSRKFHLMLNAYNWCEALGSQGFREQDEKQIFFGECIRFFYRIPMQVNIEAYVQPEFELLAQAKR